MTKPKNIVVKPFLKWAGGKTASEQILFLEKTF